MTRSRFFRPALGLFALALVALPARAQQPATPVAPQLTQPQAGARIPIPNATPAHFAAARELVASTGLASSFMQVIPSLMGQINSTVTATRPELVAPMKATLDALGPEFGKLPEEMFDRAARIYTAVMTEQECKDALVFFKSPVGQKFVQEQPTIIGNLSPAIQAWSKDMSVKMFQRVREELKKKGFDI